MNSTIEIYDIELTNFSFIYGGFDISTEEYKTFVISIFKDDRIELKKHFQYLIDSKSFQFGFNNLDYDYPLIHYLIDIMNKKKFEKMSIEEILEKLNEKNKQLIPDDNIKKANKFGKNYNVVHKPYIKQLDIYKIFHWDNVSKKTSLKRAEANMRFNNVEEFEWSEINNYNKELEKKLISYNINDVNATKELYYLVRGRLDKVTVDFPGMKEYYTQDRLEFRQYLSKKYNVNLLNHNDVKIGEEIGKIVYLQKSKKTWEEIKNKKTFRSNIYLKDLVPHYFREKVKNKELKELLNVIDNTIIDVNIELQNDNKRQFNYNFIYVGNKFSFGLGGLHTADMPRIIEPNEDYQLSELDGASQYPSAIIALEVYPEHLGPEWLQACIDIKNNRIEKKKLAKKGDKYAEMEANAFKLSLNGNFYGKLGDKYNYQFDPLQKYRITIKCQLDILLYIQMLKEKIPDINIISTNTDGIVAIYHNKYIPVIEEVNKIWGDLTGIEMERTDYKKLIQRDVNNYIAIKTDGKVKYKGIFEKDLELHKDSSFYIITMALNNYFINNIPIEQTIKENEDIYNFLAIIRVQNTKQGKWTLYHIYSENNEVKKVKLQKLNRYYVCKDKTNNIIKELNNNEKFSFIEAGYSVKPLNKVINRNAKDYDIDYSYYINEANKIKEKIIGKEGKLFN